MKFGQYELLERIAVGGMAEVFKGRVVGEEGFEKHVAIKRILPTCARGRALRRRCCSPRRASTRRCRTGTSSRSTISASRRTANTSSSSNTSRATTCAIAHRASCTARASSSRGAVAAHRRRDRRGAALRPRAARAPTGSRWVSSTATSRPRTCCSRYAGEVKLSDFGLAKRRTDHSVVGIAEGQPGVHVARAGEQAAAGSAHRHLLAGRGAVRAAHRAAAARDHRRGRGLEQVASGVVPSARALRPDLPGRSSSCWTARWRPIPPSAFPDAAAFGTAIRGALAELNIAVGASDLSALLGMITPPRQRAHADAWNARRSYAWDPRRWR